MPAPSIRATPFGPTPNRECSASSAQVLRVLISRQETGRRFLESDADKPAFSVGVRIHDLRSGEKILIHFDDLAGYGAEKFRHSLDGFNRAERFAGFNLC